MSAELCYCAQKIIQRKHSRLGNILAVENPRNKMLIAHLALVAVRIDLHIDLPQ